MSFVSRPQASAGNDKIIIICRTTIDCWNQNLRWNIVQLSGWWVENKCHLGYCKFVLFLSVPKKIILKRYSRLLNNNDFWGIVYYYRHNIKSAKVAFGNLDNETFANKFIWLNITYRNIFCIFYRLSRIRRLLR